MKYIVVLGDGMADEPIEKLGGITPLAYADTPMLDALSKIAEIGMVHTIPEGMSPGSDTANLSVLGYDPKIYYSGRSPLEALSIGVPMGQDDIAIRCNFITISETEDSFCEKVIIDHSADEISTEDCAILLDAVKQTLEQEEFTFHLGTSYRHCCIWKDYKQKELLLPKLTPPHDVLEQKTGDWLPENLFLRQMMERSYQILNAHPLNQKRRENGLKPANCCWFWGAGTKPMLPSFEEKNGIRGMMVSAVDLLKGIAIGAGMGTVVVEGANGGLHTNYEGKVEASLKAILQDGYDFVYLHVEAPDEMGHQGKVEKKVEAITYLDQRVIAPIRSTMDKSGEAYRLLVLPDHPTPIRIRTHTGEAVPYLLYDSTRLVQASWNYNEAEAMQSGNQILKGDTLIDYFLKK